MSNENLPKFIFHAFDSCLSYLTRPFYKSDSAENFSTAGYRYIFSVFMLILLGILWYTGYLGAPISKLPANWGGVAKALLSNIGLKDLPEIPMAALSGFVYGAGYLIKPVRISIGELFAKLFFNLMHVPIMAGEWCIEHRGVTTIIIIGVFGFLVWGIPHEFQVNRQIYSARQDLDYWLYSVEGFIESSALSSQENDKYNKLFKWKADFDRLVKLPENAKHPASCLNEILNLLYADKTNDTWQIHLKINENKIKMIMAECKARQESDFDSFEARSWALINILMGRIYVRLSQIKGSADELVRAMECFTAADISRYKKNTNDIQRYQPAVNNGKGQVYANAFTFYINGGPSGLTTICGSPSECANFAIRAYDKASNGAQSCTFQDKRRKNNITDLLLRIGIKFHQTEILEFDAPLNKWTASRNSLADKIEASVKEMMECNDTDPFIVTTFITVAEAYGLCSMLRKQSGDERGAVRVMQTAGAYLSLAHSFDKRDFPSWNLSYFCSMIKNGELDPVFYEAVTSKLEGLPAIEVNEIILKLKKSGKCL